MQEKPPKFLTNSSLLALSLKHNLAKPESSLIKNKDQVESPQGKSISLKIQDIEAPKDSPNPITEDIHLSTLGKLTTSAPGCELTANRATQTLDARQGASRIIGS